MNRPREIEQIEATLGRTFTTQELGPYTAFCSPIDAPINQTSGRQGDVAIGGVREALDYVTKQLEEHCLLWSAATGYTVFVGYPDAVGPHSVFAVANADPIHLMDIFDVGNYNDLTGDTPDRAKRYMAKLFKTDPFVPYHVDAANFKVRFVNPVSAARAGEIAQAVVEFNPEAYALVSPPRFEDEDEFANRPAGPESQSEDESPVDVMQRLIMNTRKLELWWD